MALLPLAPVIALAALSVTAVDPGARPESGLDDIAVLIAPHDPEGGRAARFLAQQLEEVPHVETTTAAVGSTELIRAAANARPEAFVVILDSRAGRIDVLRTHDGILLSRPMSPTTAHDSPYAMAISAAELLELARSRSADELIAAGGLRTRAEWSPSLFLAAAFGITAAPAHEPTLWQPMVGVGFALANTGGVFVSLGGRVSFVGGTTLRGASQGIDLEYRRTDGELRLMTGVQLGASRWGAGILGGGSSSRVEATQAGETLARESRFAGWLGGGLEAQWQLFAGLSVALDGAVVWVPRPARYLVRGDVALREGDVRLRASLTLTYAFELGSSGQGL